MKRVISFSKYFIPATILSVILAGISIAGYFNMGFNKGVDFQPGLIQQIQFAPAAFRLTYSGPGNAVVSLGGDALDVIVQGAGTEAPHHFAYSSYPSQADLVRGLRQIEGLNVSDPASAAADSSWLVQSAQSDSTLEAENPFVIHYLSPGSEPVMIEDVRAALLPLGTVSVQVLGNPEERRFMVRMEDSEIVDESGDVPSEKVITALENTSFGRSGVVVTRSDYVGERFSKQLSDQAGFLMVMTLLLILAYCSIRFKIQFALGAVLAIIHDAVIMVGFIVWTRMEFNTVTIAALLTILGYSINDTVVIFDRMKETRRMYPDDRFVNILNRAISETFGRTVITTVTTMLAVVSLYVFTGGSMKDFALALLVGMLSGVYSTIFIASGFVCFWDSRARKREKSKLKAVAARA